MKRIQRGAGKLAYVRIPGFYKTTIFSEAFVMLVICNKKKTHTLNVLTSFFFRT